MYRCCESVRNNHLQLHVSGGSKNRQATEGFAIAASRFLAHSRKEKRKRMARVLIIPPRQGERNGQKQRLL
jgi:hypothetical protein